MNMKTLLCVTITIFATVLYCCSLPTTSTQYVNHKPAIVFDLGGVVVSTNSKKFVTKYLGITPLISYCVKNIHTLFSIKQSLQKNWIRTLDTVGEINPTYCSSLCDYDNSLIHITDDQGNKLPGYMISWLIGTASNQDILNAITTSIDVHPKKFTCPQLMKDMAHGIFDPQAFVDSRTIDQNMVSLITELKKEGYPLYILSNWDKESFHIMKKQYAAIFDLFDGYLISGEVHSAKPAQTIFRHFEQLFPHDAYIFIDDQRDNIKAASLRPLWHPLQTKTDKPNIAKIREKIMTTESRVHDVSTQIIALSSAQ